MERTELSDKLDIKVPKDNIKSYCNICCVDTPHYYIGEQLDKNWIKVFDLYNCPDCSGTKALNHTEHYRSNYEQS